MTDQIKQKIIAQFEVAGGKQLKEEVAAINKKIQQQGRAVQKATKKFTAAQIAQKAMKKDVKGLGKQFNSLTGPFRMSQDQFVKFNKNGGKFNGCLAKMSNGFRMATAGMRGFKMEMLGVMFFGMAMPRLFMRLLRPAMEAVGIFEIWGTILEILFLPVVLAMLQPMLDLLDRVSNLSPEVKLLYGRFAVAGVIIGTLLMLVGTLTLGFGALAVAIGGPVFVAGITIMVVLVSMGFVVIGLIKIIRNWGTDSTEVIKGLGLVFIGLGLVILGLSGPIGWAVIAFGAFTYYMGSESDKLTRKWRLHSIKNKISWFEFFLAVEQKWKNFITKMSKLPLIGKQFKKILPVFDKGITATKGKIADLNAEAKLWQQKLDGTFIAPKIIPMDANGDPIDLTEDLAKARLEFATNAATFNDLDASTPTTDLGSFESDLNSYKTDIDAQQTAADKANVIINQELNIQAVDLEGVKDIVEESNWELAKNISNDAYYGE